MEKDTILTREYKLCKLKELMDGSEKDIVIKAIAEANKMQGDYAPTENKNINTNVTIDPRTEIVAEEARKHHEQLQRNRYK